jgi:hypothetical protein
MAGLLGWLRGKRQPHSTRFVSATRLDERAFWESSALGSSLRALKDPRVIADVAFANTAGLPEVYNAAIGRAGPGERLVFLHDDVWLEDADPVAVIEEGLAHYDVIGVAGNVRRQPGQPTWMHRPDLEIDQGFQSGAIRHGAARGGQRVGFGPFPAACELLDGVLLAAKADTLHSAQVRFDPRFSFHFYDLDFSRTSRRAGLTLGTWRVDVTHQSAGGGFDSPQWGAAYEVYAAKWGD